MHPLDYYYDELVDIIYKVPLSADGWQPFVKRVNTLLNASSIHVLAIDLKKDVFSFSNCSGSLSDDLLTVAELQYLRYPIGDDPRMVDFFSTDERLDWYQCHHKITEEVVGNTALYQNILLPIDMRYTSMHDIYRDEKICVMIGINTSRERGYLSEEELKFLDRLLMHLKRVVLLQRKLYEFSANSIVGYNLINKLSKPVLLLNLSGQVVHYNDAVKKVCENNSIIKIENDKLVLPKPYDLQLAENLNYFESFFKKNRVLGNQKIEDSCIKITSIDGETIYIFSTFLVSENEMKMFGIRPLVMLTLYDPSHTETLDLNFLCATFHLTPAESKLALMLVDGFLLKEISQKNNVNVDTVRKQLQSIYKKTGTNRQSDLVKLLINMPKFMGES